MDVKQVAMVVADVGLVDRGLEREPRWSRQRTAVPVDPPGLGAIGSGANRHP
jgi:hypothetical protein